MAKHSMARITLMSALSLAACDGKTETPTPDSGVNSPDSGMMMMMTLYERLGGEAAITAVVNGFVGRVVADPKINGYFLNSSVDGGRLVKCLVKLVGAATGGPQQYPGAGQAADADGCRNMKDAHVGLGISMTDFTDLAGHLVAELQAAGVAQEDIDTIVGALTPLAEDIVENPNDNETIYLRAGRKPGVQTVIADFVNRVVADPKINGFFLNSSLNAERLGTCLVRQVCAATGGPCKYGEEVGPELFDNTPCRDMTSTHQGLGISTADFTDLAGHLVAALQAAQVAQDDIDAIVGAVAPLSDQIVENPNDDETIYLRIGRKPAVQAVVNDFAGRVLGDASLNGFFSATDANRLGICLVRQVCAATGGPCRYGMEAGPELIADTPCRDMVSTHAGLTSPAGGAGAPITKADFDALVGHLIDVLDDAGVANADRDAIVNTLAPLCPDIVADGTGC